MRTMLAVSLVTFAVADALCFAAEAQTGLVGWYTFEDAAGAVARDSSGAGNDGAIKGGAEFAKGEWGSALSLNGKDGYVDCGKAESLNIAQQGTVMLWCQPRTLRGGLAGWQTGGGWPDARLMLTIDTWPTHGGPKLVGCFADGKEYRSFAGFGDLACGAWTHLAFTFDGRALNLYRDGLLRCSMSPGLTPDIHGVPLWIGRVLGLGHEYFDGLIDEVRIYARPLGEAEVFGLYREHSAGRGIAPEVFRRPLLAVQPCPGPGKLMVDLDARTLRPLPASARFQTALLRAGARKPAGKPEVSEVPATGKTQVFLDVQALEPGEYELRASVTGDGGQALGEEVRVAFSWPGQPEEFGGIKVLNNLVWELLNAEGSAALGLVMRKSFAFANPRDGWVFIRSTVAPGGGEEVALTLDGESREKALLVHRPGSATAQEAMRFLRAGPHTLHVHRQGGARLERVVVRAVPVLQHAFYNAHPHIHPYGPYDWEFLAKDIRPNVNMMLSGGTVDPVHLAEWKAAGRSWATIIGLPKDLTPDDAGVDKAYQHWSAAPGLQDPRMDGIIIDEFGGGDEPVYDIYRKAVERIYAAPQSAGRVFMPYGGTFYGKDRSRTFAQECMRGGGYVCWERYLPEQPTEEAARDCIRRQLIEEMPRWEAGLPGVTRRMVMVFGSMSQPTESLNTDPTVDFRAYMDMQFRTLATHPLLFGLGGIQEYHSSYCDEENLRLIGRLYRHYAIEGNTEPFIRSPYKLGHIQNPDFEPGLAGWTIREAEPGCVTAGKRSGYSWLEGRYPPTSQGNTFLLMRRAAKGPNSFAQPILKLTPGQLYSLKMITGDYQDLTQEKSNKTTHAVSIRLDGADILPGPKDSFQFVFPNNYAHKLGKFDAKYPYWMNYHWRVFRAGAESAQLTVSDWASDKAPGGPAGQELMFNFIEIQPYLGE